MMDEFPHEAVPVEVAETTYDRFGNPIPGEIIEGEPFECFIDTPTATEAYNALKLEYKLDRYMYYPYGAVELNVDDVIAHEDVQYKVNRKPEDQGGMHEIMRVSLEEVV